MLQQAHILLAEAAEHSVSDRVSLAGIVFDGVSTTVRDKCAVGAARQRLCYTTGEQRIHNGRCE
ncbi:hypothetical protein D3C84_1082790 [compost metagenome]